MAIDVSTKSQELLRQLMLSLISDNVDKREGSLINAAISPMAYVLSLFYYDLEEIVNQTFVSTATGEYLEMRCAERGLTRNTETAAIRRGKFNMAIDIGEEFTATGSPELVYTVTEYIEKDSAFYYYKMQCNTKGSVGNGYTGELTSNSYISGLTTAVITDILTAGEDTETDDSLRQRYYDSLSNKSFGGNIASYKEAVNGITGVGGCQLYPIWNGGGTLKIVVITSDYGIPSDELINTIQMNICPPVAPDTTPSIYGYGVAPIGAMVTIAKPTRRDINVTADLTLAADLVESEIISNIEKSIESYFLEKRKGWSEDLGDLDIQYSTSIYLSQIISLIVQVAGVVNCQNVLLDGNAYDINLTENSRTQELPFLGSFTKTN